MIAFLDAIDLIKSHPLRLSLRKMTSVNAQNMVLAEDIIAPINLPPFDNSAVDGYAVLAESVKKNQSLAVMGSVRAKAQVPLKLSPQVAAKIMTGAPMPIGADAVAMKEDVEIVGDKVLFHEPLPVHANVRFLGEDIRKGAMVAKRGTLVTPQLIAVLYGLGVEEITVFKLPRISIISTGDELVMAPIPLDFGQVYYLIGPMLKAQCQALGIIDVDYKIVPDDEEATTLAIKNAMDADILLLTGGMSKGDYDFVRPALKNAQVSEVFYQGAWRPGKPLFFGIRDHTRIFGLPGNPVAAFVCFHVFVRSLILQAMGVSENVKLKRATLMADFSKKAGIVFFARANVNENNELWILPGQGSHQIFNLSQANALALIPSEKGIVKAHEVIHYFPI